MKYRYNTTYKAGDEIKILSHNEIKKTLDYEQSSDGLFFDESMRGYCGDVLELSYPDDFDEKVIWKIKGCHWWWSEKWFKLIVKNFLTDKDFEI